MSEISNGSELHAAFDELGFLPPAAQFRFQAAFAIPPVLTLRYFADAVQDRSDDSNGNTIRHHFCAATQMTRAFCVILGLVVDLAVREQNLLLDEPSMAALLFLNQYLLH